MLPLVGHIAGIPFEELLTPSALAISVGLVVLRIAAEAALRRGR
ncbi:hypothetical protein [Vulcanimicrobium alpinum]|nr:hypothetical protein [Vulcanimicrobium alpinum]